MKNLSASSLLKPLNILFTKFHFTLFIILVVAGLGGAVMLLNNMLINLSTIDPSYTSSISPGSIDQATLERIKELHSSDESFSTTKLPDGRTNPFGE